LLQALFSFKNQNFALRGKKDFMGLNQSRVERSAVAMWLSSLAAAAAAAAAAPQPHSLLLMNWALLGIWVSVRSGSAP
jgi:hypothetical protein